MSMVLRDWPDSCLLCARDIGVTPLAAGRVLALLSCLVDTSTRETILTLELPTAAQICPALSRARGQLALPGHLSEPEVGLASG